MANIKVKPTGTERFFGEDELIVSKTDTNGRITYANHVFLRVAGYTESEVVGKPHSLIRHPEMPRCVFKYLWDTIQTGNEVFAYVVNLCKNGDHYWVFAHVTPTFDASNKIIGYHSNRRVPDKRSVDTIKGLYTLLLKEESNSTDPRKGLENSYHLLANTLSEKKTTYEEFIFSF